MKLKVKDNNLLEAYVGDGKMINSEFLNGLNVVDAKEKIIKEIETRQFGERKTLLDLKTGVYLGRDIGDVQYQ